MRRKDREMILEFSLKIIDKSTYGVLSLIDADGAPYGIPLSIIRDRDNLYFHSAKQGKKVEALQNGNPVSIAFVGRVEVPELYSESQLSAFLEEEHGGKTLISKVFTTEFESAIVLGTVHKVEEESERINAMRLICKKYTPSKMHLFDLAIISGMERTAIYRIEIKSITGKRKQFDTHGEEMKWGRME